MLDGILVDDRLVVISATMRNLSSLPVTFWVFVILFDGASRFLFVTLWEAKSMGPLLANVDSYLFMLRFIEGGFVFVILGTAKN